VDQAREDVAAHRVGAENEHCSADRRQRRRMQCRVAELLARVVGRDDIGEQRAEDEQGKDRKPITAPRFLRKSRQSSRAGVGGALATSRRSAGPRSCRAPHECRIAG
jgi:hypothetical protein